MVFQSYALFPHMTVGQNIEFALARAQGPARPSGAGIAERIARARPAPGHVRHGRSRRSPAASSSASRSPARWRRTRACCCSTSRSPRSTSSCASSMQVEIKRIQREVGVTTVAVTHDQTEAMTMSDRVAIMRDGEIEQIDTPEDALPPARDACSPRASSARRTCCPSRTGGSSASTRRCRRARAPPSCAPRSSRWRRPPRPDAARLRVQVTHRELPGHALPDRVPASGVRHDRRDAAARHPARAHRAGIDAGARRDPAPGRCTSSASRCRRRAPRRSSRPPSRRWSRRSSGPIAAADLGVTSMHEHLLLDARILHAPSREPPPDDPRVTIENLGFVRWNLLALEDNLVLDDAALAARELGLAAAEGQRARRRPHRLGARAAARRACRRSRGRPGMHVVAGCGVYLDRPHPPEVRGLGEEGLTELLRTALDDAHPRRGVPRRAARSHRDERAGDRRGASRPCARRGAPPRRRARP